MIRLFILPVILIIVECFAFQLLKSFIKSKRNRWIYIGLTIAFYIGFTLIYVFHDRAVGQTQTTLWANGFLLLNAISKLVLAFFALAEDVVRLPIGLFRKLTGSANERPAVPARRKFIAQVGLGLMAVPFLGILDGILFGRFRFRVLTHQVFFPDLPDGLEGYKIMQLSDLHLGSIDNPEHLQEAVRLINATSADLLVMTGDLVNTLAAECEPHYPWLNQIRSFSGGKYAVLGNHDYGEYIKWPSDEAKQANFVGIKEAYAKAQFTLLNNANAQVEHQNATLNVVGVENWGRNFIQKGDLDLATGNLDANDFKVLLTHDPSHWEEVARKDPRHYQLTLSGHTHGMQFGIEIPGVRWSPIQWIYQHWAGLYCEENRYLYVNRGFGYHAYPGRTGVWPEITVFELKKGPSVPT